MARSINDLYNFYQFILRKQRGVYISPEQFCANMDAGQLDAVEDFFALYGKDQIIHDGIKNFKVIQPFASSSIGEVTFPSNYLHLVGQPYTVSGSTIVGKITIQNEDRFPTAMTSQLRAPTLSHPIAEETATGFNIVPRQTQLGTYTYIRRPATPVLAYTLSGSNNRTVTYNAAGSTQLEWQEQYFNYILAKALVYSGVNMNEKEIAEYAEVYKAQIAPA